MAQTLFDLLGDPEAAAFAPAFAKDKRRKPSNIDVLNAGIAGIGDLAYDAVGFPVDLSAGLMRALGAQTGQTPFGSDWLKQKATNIGIRPPESADPTLRDVRLGAEMMAGGIDPFATAKGIGVVGSKVAKELEPTLFNALDTYAQKAGLQPSILPPDAAKKVIGQTKAVNTAGFPNLVYRGSRMEKGAPLEWSEARQGQTGKGKDTGQWFSDNPTVATSYAGSRGQEGYVAPAYLDMRNPLVVDAKGNTWGEIPRAGLGELASRIPKETLTTDEIARIAKAQGYDGVEFKNVMDVGPAGEAYEIYKPSTVYVSFNPKAARSALSDKAIAGAARVPPRPKAPVQQAVQVPTIEAPVSPAGFYSATEQAALNLTKTKGTGQSLLDELMKAPNVKKDEMEAIGLLDAFQNKKQVTKQELIDYIGKNKVELGSTVRGDYEVPKVNINRLGAGDIGEIFKSPNGYTADGAWNFGFTSPDTNKTRFYNAYRIPSSNGVGGVRIPERVELYDSNRNLVDEFRTLQDAQRYVENDAVAAARNDFGPTRPKFQDYAYQGGQNYKETLLTLPEIRASDLARQAELRSKPMGSLTQDELTELSNISRGVGRGGDQGLFTSGHWEQPNVMAHVRTQDFVDADGKKMRLIEEVQSDWHQAGREKGYGNKLKERYSFNELPDGRIELLDEGRLVSTSRNMDDAVQEAKAVDGYDYGVPDAPMKETWYQTALRKAVKDAIDAGQDRVGITTGARQVKRYNLSKQASSIQYNPETKQLWVYGVGEQSYSPIVSKIVPKEELSQYVGKEAADKLLKSKMKSQNVGGEKTLWHEIKGKDLQVGGEGMRKYYDETYPKYLEKFAKKYGATVKEGSVPTERSRDANGIPSMYPEQESVRYIDITPEMRKAFGGKDKGVPLFQAAPLIPVGIGAGGLLDQFGERQQ